MENKEIRKILIILTLLVGNSVFMMQLGAIDLSDDTLNTIGNFFGFGVLSILVEKIMQGSLIIISYVILLFIIKDLFSQKKN